MSAKKINYLKIIFKLACMFSFSIVVAALTGCATIVSGTQQTVKVSTTPVVGAKCVLENNKGKWVVPSTPQSINVYRSYNDMHIICSKRGHKPVSTTVVSYTKPIVFGNAIIGGGIGAGIDIADGAAYDYPQNVDIDMA